MIFKIIVASVYAVALMSYFFIEIKPKLFPWRIAVKVFLASAYVVYAFVNALSDGNYSTFEKIVCAACSLAWLGDTFLLFKKTFGIGAFFFLLCNFAFIAAEISAVSQINSPIVFVSIAIALFVLFYGGLVLMQIVKFCDLGKQKVLLNLYVAAMTVSGSLGCALVFFTIAVRYLLFGIGVMLFMISDYFLGAYLFKRSSHVLLVSNSASYFAGMFLIALCLAF